MMELWVADKYGMGLYIARPDFDHAILDKELADVRLAREKADNALEDVLIQVGLNG